MSNVLEFYKDLSTEECLSELLISGKIIDDLVTVKELVESGKLPLNRAIWCPPARKTCTLLILAIQIDGRDLFSMLLRMGANVKIGHNGEAPIFASLAIQGHAFSSMVKAIVDSDRTTLQQLKHGCTVMQQLCSYRDFDRMKFMLELGADINQKSTNAVVLGGTTMSAYTTFSYAVLLDDREMVEFLVQSKADVNATANYFFSHADGDSIAQELSPLHYVCQRPFRGPRQFHVMSLLNYGCDIDSVDPDGKTCLWKAVDRLDEAMASELLLRYANPHVKSNEVYGCLSSHDKIMDSGMATVKDLLTQMVQERHKAIAFSLHGKISADVLNEHIFSNHEL